MIASLIHNSELIYFSESLLPNHFSDKQNACLYLAITKLVEQSVKTMDAFNLIHVLESTESTRRYAELLQVNQLEEFLDMCNVLSRKTEAEYKMLVDDVLDAAKRRDLYRKLKECESLCLSDSVEEIEVKIYEALDDIMIEYATNNEVPSYGEVVDDCWAEIEERQAGGFSGIPFKFPALNDFATIEVGELFIFGAEQKQGKSMMLLNCAVDLMAQGYGILYLDSELNTRLFTARMISHLTRIPYRMLTTGTYSSEDKERIMQAKAWLKAQRFTHIYIPMFDQQTIYTVIKKVKHTQGIDVLIVDYFKGKSEGNAFDSYQELGRFVDMIKNQICGDMKIAGIGAAQATAGTGKLADSAKIGRNASTIAMITTKTPEELQADGPDCGNKKLQVTINRNGMQMAHGEYIDLHFDGNLVLYEQAKRQHVPQNPY